MPLLGDKSDKQEPIQPEQRAGTEDAYERAMRRALARMEKGFDLGGNHTMDREALHDRKALRQTDSH